MDKMTLKDLLETIINDPEYPKDKSWEIQDLFETYAIVSELLDANDAYDYKKTSKTTWSYNDILGNTFYVKLTYIPKLNKAQEDYIELKTFWLDEAGKPQYSDTTTNSTNKDLQTRSDTLAKIYRDEIIPFFIEQNITNRLRIVPVDKIRYRLSKMLVGKYTPDTMDIQYLDTYIQIIK